MMEEETAVKKEQEDQGSQEEDVKPTDLSAIVFNYKQEMEQLSDVNIKYEESNKMYICHLCDFRTAFRNSLLNHQAVHSDFRPWVCAMCDYAAKRKQDLKKHLHTIHGVMVESTMLKPVGAAGTSISNPARSLSRGESSEDNSWDSMKVGKVGDANISGSNAPYLSTPLDSVKAAGGGNMAGVVDASLMSVKQEMLEKSSSPPSNQGTLPSKSIHNSPPDSPDYDLPISFSPSLVSKQKHSMPGTDSPFASEKNDSVSEMAQKVIQGEKFHRQSSPHSMPTLSHKRPHASLDSRSDSFKTQDVLISPVTKQRKTVDSDDLLPCSSSVSISHARASQTPTSFLCEYCDILFFQRAMYLMHVGLHSLDNPWCCAVCGSTFTEKYSFTSHFINQH